MRIKKIIIIITCSIMCTCVSKQAVDVEPQNIEIQIVEIQHRQPIIRMMRIEGGILNLNSSVNIDSFYLGVFPVTQKEYLDVMGINPSFFKGDNLPVENLSWIDALEFCNRLSEREGLTPVYTINGNTVTWDRNANGYRLPTDSEWEYACRAGTITPFNTGNNITTNQANFDGRFPFNSSIRGEYRQRTTPVGTFAANSWGLFDMHGNVWEWCWDGTNGMFSDDPIALLNNTTRVIRGGGWSSSGRSLHSSFRSGFQPQWKNNYLGFRVARNSSFQNSN